MNKTIEALKLAENALRDIIRVYKFEGGAPVTALAAIREALAEPVKQEPVAFVSDVHLSRYTLEWNGQPLPEGTKLYAAPVERHWYRLQGEE